MKKQKLLFFVSLACLSFFLNGCHVNEGKEETAKYQSVVFYYKYIRFNPQKAEAAKFLIENMKYHTSTGVVVSVDSRVETWRAESDALYSFVIDGHSLSDFPKDSLERMQKEHRVEMEKDSLPEVMCDMKPRRDTDIITPRFLVRHIDHAFKVWRSSPFARKLSFDEFKEYILPYRAIEGYGFNMTGKKYGELFEKYVRSDTASTVRNAVQAYNQAIYWLRGMNGNTKRERKGGIYDLYTHGKHDCVDVASYGCNILRACGIPVVVEFNVCYRNFSGRHYHCSVWNNAKAGWEDFNAESSLPGSSDLAFSETMNVYRQLYGAQRNTPYFLRNDGEPIPPLLDNPCIVDVTSRLRTTTSITLPMTVKTDNRLAYLATFSHEFGGTLPVTWGVIDPAAQTVTFENVVPDAIYFPVYYEGQGLVSFGAPFCVSLPDTSDENPVISPVPFTDYDGQDCDTLSTLTLTRKFPRKPNMIRLAEELIGGRILGANKRDFSDAVTLLTLKQPLPPNFVDYPLERTGLYRYYRFQASEEHPHANISMLEWITESKYGYKNVLPPSRPHILVPSDTLKLKEDARLVKLLDDESWEKMNWKAEYDGNMQTAPGAYPNITLWLKEPQVVTRVRMAPKNADNGIQGGDRYQLLYWDGDWKSIGLVRASHEYVTFHNIPKGKLYWLRNLDRGKEEMPFVVDGEEQKFIYNDIINH